MYYTSHTLHSIHGSKTYDTFRCVTKEVVLSVHSPSCMVNLQVLQLQSSPRNDNKPVLVQLMTIYLELHHP